ncbi:MAG: family 16 glycoside hydrolase [Planctomycetota bacterium]|jgi:hypothetical protein
MLCLASVALCLPLCLQDEPRQAGLTLRLFELPYAPKTIPTLAPDQTPNVDRRVDSLGLRNEAFGELGAPHLTHAIGWLWIEEVGTYRLQLASDDGSRMSLDGERIVDNDGAHGTLRVASEPLELSAGEHALFIEHFDSGGSRELRLEWQTPGSEAFVEVPESALRCEFDPTRVTSPGPKLLEDGLKPGTGLPVAGVHPGWRVEDIRPEGFEPSVGSMAFLPDGRLALGTFSPLQRDEVSLPDIESKAPDAIWALDVDSGEVTEIATDVFEPTGMLWFDGALHVANRRAVVRLDDADGDGYFEQHTVVGDGWEGWNYHQFAFDLVERDGLLYTALSTSMAPPGWEGMQTNSGPNGPMRGGIVEIDPTSGDARVIAGGTRTPNGLGLDSAGNLFYADNQGAWMPTSILGHVRPGVFFGHRNWTEFVPKLSERFPEGGHPSAYMDRPRELPALWLPHGEVVNSPTDILEVPDGAFAGQLLIGELTAGGIRRACMEEVQGVLQGCLLRFTQGLECGVQRLEWGPDGALYAGGIGANGNWSWRGKRFGLQRLVPTGEEVFEIHSVRATPEGFAVQFTQPVDPEWLQDTSNYAVSSWTYEPTQAYGGPKVGVVEHAVAKATPLSGLPGVHLEIEGLREGTCVHLVAEPESLNGEPIWSGEAWYTLNRKPREREGLPLDVVAIPVWNESSGPTLKIGDAWPPDNRSAESLLSGSEFLSLRGGQSAAMTTRTWKTWMRFYPRAQSESESLFGSWWVTPIAPGEKRKIGIDSRYPGFFARKTGRFGTEEHLGYMEFSAGGRDGDSGIDLREVSVLHQPEPIDPGPWRDLLSDPQAWQPRGGQAEFSFGEGSLRGTALSNSPNTYLTSQERFADFELLFEVKVHPELNSGVQIRSDVQGGFDNRAGQLAGFQVEIDPSARAWSGGLYETGGRAWVHPLHAAPYARRAWRQGEWNRYRVVADGPWIRTWINGVPAAEIYDEARMEGHLGLQVHSVPDRGEDGAQADEPLTVEWRRLRIRELR